MVEERNARFGQYDADGVMLPAKWEEVSCEKVDFRTLSAKPNFYVLVDEKVQEQPGIGAPGASWNFESSLD